MGSEDGKRQHPTAAAGEQGASDDFNWGAGGALLSSLGLSNSNLHDPRCVQKDWGIFPEDAAHITEVP